MISIVTEVSDLSGQLRIQFDVDLSPWTALVFGTASFDSEGVRFSAFVHGWGCGVRICVQGYSTRALRRGVPSGKRCPSRSVPGVCANFRLSHYSFYSHDTSGTSACGRARRRSMFGPRPLYRLRPHTLPGTELEATGVAKHCSAHAQLAVKEGQRCSARAALRTR